MKNSLSKTLLCGVLASTFFLINCQKAPSRGVKADSAAGTSAQTLEQKIVGKVSVACSDTFIKSIEDSRLVRTKIEANVKAAMEKTKDLSDVEKAEIKTVREDLILKNDVVRSEMDKMKKGEVAAEACTKGADAYIFETMKTQMLSLQIDAATVAGADDARYKSDVLAKKDLESKKDSTTITEKMKLTVSAELAEALKTENKDGEVYFSEGSITKNSGNDLETLKKNKAKTVCELTSITIDTVALTEGDILTVMSSTSKKKDLRSALELTLMNSDKAVYIFNCLIAEDKAAAKEFRKAFGKHLKSKTEIEKDTTDGKTDLEKAEKKLAKATTAYDEAVIAAKTAKDAYDVKKVEIDAARDKKDATLIDSLNTKAEPFKAKMVKTEKAVKEALKAKEEAQAKVDLLK